MTVKATVASLPPPGPLPYFVDAARGWLADGNEILGTADGGGRFTRLFDADSKVLGFTAITPQRGWAVTASGLLSTANGGASWETVWKGDGDALRSIRFVDAQNGWASGKDGLLATQDGGHSWAPAGVKSPCEQHWMDGSYSFIGTENGWAICPDQPGAGTQGKRLYHTSDRGRTWALIASAEMGKPYESGLPRGGYVSGIYFLDGAHGWISESRGGLLDTDDGGKTWRWINTGQEGEQFLGNVHFVSQRVGFVTSTLGGYAVLLGTQDGGATWGQIYPPLTPLRAVSSLPVYFFDPQSGVAAGTLLDSGAILRTADGGHTWAQVSSLKGERVLSLQFADRRHGWALTQRWTQAGTQRTLYRTSDEGTTWSQVSQAENGTELYGSISFVDARTGYVGTNHGHLLVTHDGGQSFTVLDRTDSRRFYYQFADALNGWAVDQFQLETTADGGKTWTPMPLGYQAREFRLLPGGGAWMVAGDCQRSECFPILLSTADGGVNWIRYDLGGIRPTGVTATDISHAWLEDEAGHIYATDDGGQSWTQLP